MNYYKISFRDLRQEHGMGEMLSALERGFSKYGVDYYLIGAIARDVWMGGINDIKPMRGTRDVDFAILINNIGVFEALRAFLIEMENFQPNHDNTFLLSYKGKYEVDLMPFGEIEKDGRVTVSGTGFTSIDVPGFREVYEEGLPELYLEGRYRFKFCTLPGIVLLKFMAWHDRPEVRTKDIEDICDILKNYFEMQSDYIYEKHNDLFGDEKELIDISCVVLGREIGKIVKRNKNISARILQIFEENTSNIAESKIGDLMTKYFHNQTDINVTLLKLIAQGVKENN